MLPPMVHLCAHARRQARRRRVTEQEVEEALARPDTRYPSQEYPEQRTVLLGRTAGGKRLKVVVLTDDPEYVVTVADRDGEE